MDIKKIQTDKISRGTNTCEYIILHHSGGMNFNNTVEYLAVNPAEVSCHYIVGQVGEIIQIAGDKQITWHAGISEREGKTNLNDYSIGIEIVSDGHVYTEMQYDAVNKIVVYLMDKHNLLPENIIRHLDISGDRGKRDVSDNFWNRFHKTYKDYQNYLGSKLKEMLFYKKLYTEAMKDVERNNKVIKDPEGAFEKMKDLSKEEMLSELIYFTCFGLEKLKGNIK